MVPDQHEGDRRDRGCAADSHQALEEPRIGLEVLRPYGQRRGDEDGQGSGRILDGEVAVGHLSALDLVAVSLVDRGVEQQAVRVEAVMEHPPGRQERRDRERGDERGESVVGRRGGEGR